MSDEPSTRSRIIKAASHLFYAEGIRAVGVDAIAARAGVTKKTLYYHFTSKDEVIAAYLAAHDAPNLAAFARRLREAKGSLPDRMEAFFARMAKAARHPHWKCCGFLRTSAELANMPGHPARAVIAAQKKKVESWLTETFRDHGLQGPEAVARQIAVLIDGAFSGHAGPPRPGLRVDGGARGAASGICGGLSPMQTGPDRASLAPIGLFASASGSQDWTTPRKRPTPCATLCRFFSSPRPPSQI